MSRLLLHLLFTILNLIILCHMNSIVPLPYMDELFHFIQAQQYSLGHFTFWHEKITTPPGIYLISIITRSSNLFLLRLTSNLSLSALPFFIQKYPVTIASFPIAWFFGFLYYTDLQSLLFVLATLSAADASSHSLAAFLGFCSCFFRQTNIIWLAYAYAKSLNIPSTQDLFHDIISIPRLISLSIIPYAIVFALFALFVVWNGGIVLGDKSNHIPVLHIPQLYYFLAFATFFGFPVLFSRGILFPEIFSRMFGTPRRLLITAITLALMSLSVHHFTIHHPFLLSDNRHYTFYIWHRIFMFHPIVPQLLVPFYLVAAWAWFLRLERDKSILQRLLLPIFTIPTLLPTPLLETRYFLIPYILLRIQITDVPSWAVTLEAIWYTSINAITMYVFLYKERPDVGRFMW